VAVAIPALVGGMAVAIIGAGLWWWIAKKRRREKMVSRAMIARRLGGNRC
jgi:hypothetical protein